MISTTQTNWLSFLKGTNIYDPDRLNLDRELLRQFYLKNGYADVRIVSAIADLDRDGKASSSPTPLTKARNTGSEMSTSNPRCPRWICTRCVGHHEPAWPRL